MAFSENTEVLPQSSTADWKAKYNTLAEIVGDVSVLTTTQNTSLVTSINDLQDQINTVITGEFALINDEYMTGLDNVGGSVNILKVNASNEIEFGTNVGVINIDGGTITSLSSALSIANGGTGSSTASDARTALGLAIGSDVQAHDSNLDQISGLTVAENSIIIGNASLEWEAQTPAQARVSLGLEIGVDVQAFDAELSQFSGLVPAGAGLTNFIYGTNDSWSIADAATMRTSLGLIIGTNVQAFSSKLSQIADLTPDSDSFIVGNGTAWTKKTLSEVSSIMGTVPVGSVFPFAGTTAPDNYLFADGSAVSRTTYANLFAVIGTTYGAGNGSTTFNLPNYKGKIPIGYDSAVTLVNANGKTFGSLNHVHVTKAHYHTPGSINIDTSGYHLTNLGHTHNGFNTATDGAHRHHIVHHSTLDPHSDPTANNYIAARVLDWSNNSWNYKMGAHTNEPNAGLTTSSTHYHYVPPSPFTGTDQPLSGQSANTQGKHSHSSSDFRGYVGQLVGGVLGDDPQNTTEANPPCLVSRFIIKY